MNLPPLHPEARIVATGPGVLAIFKPPEILSHPNTDEPGERSRCVADAEWDPESEAYLGDRECLYLCHRIDAPTSGLLLGATDPRTAAWVRKAFSAGKVEKTYHALVAGSFRFADQVWRDRLRRTRRDGALRVVSDPGGQPAITLATTLRSTRQPLPCTLLELRPRTGRTHQLRVQAALRRMPILGDRTYGDFALNRQLGTLAGFSNRLYLHASRIALALPSGKRFSATSLPEGWPLPVGEERGEMAK